MIDFDRPAFLFLVPIALFLVWLGQRGSLTRWTAAQSRTALGLRAVILVLAAMALAGPRWLTETREPAVIFLSDVSGSISAEARESARAFIAEARGQKEAQSAEAVFAREATITKTFGEKEAPKDLAEPEEDATNLHGALEFAAAILPADRPGRIVLLSDGVPTDAENPLKIAAESPIEIDTVPLKSQVKTEASATSIKAPNGVREGEIFNLTAQVHATSEIPGATVRLYQNNLLVAETPRDLPAGFSEVAFPNVRADGRMALYEVEVAAPGDTVAENNRKKIAIAHAGKARVLILDNKPEESEPLAEAWRSADFEVEVRPAQGLPDTMEGLEAFDLIVLAGISAAETSENQMKNLESWVRGFAGGLLMIGGEDSYGAGGYFRTPIAEMLPVRIEREEREETPVVALLVILDRSGSMSAPVDGQTKMALANEGASLAMDVLQSRDLFGLFAVDTRVQDVVPLARIADKPATARRIAAITAGGGGIYIYTSLAEAFPRLRDAEAKIKHIILFSDAADAEEKSAGDREGNGSSSLDLATAMLASRITLSVVALGNEEDKDTEFLRQLAAQGGGRFYLTADATTLPRLFTTETMRAAESSLREDAFLAQPTENTALKGINWSESPLLLGFNTTKLKPGAELLLTTENKDPLLAEWRFGLGQVAAFTSDGKARWASEWLGWPGYGKFWTEVARMLARPAERRDLEVRMKEQGDELILEAEGQTAEGTFRNDLTVAATVAGKDLAPVSVSLPQVAPGLYRTRIKKPEAEMAIVAVNDGTGRPVSMAWTQDYPLEYQKREDGTSLLKKLSELTGGKYDVQPQEALRPAARAVRTRFDLAPFLLGLALVLWPMDIWVRRRQWSGEKSLPPFSPAK